MQSLDLHHLRLLINLIGAVAALIASGFWFRVTATKVPDDKEKEAVLDQLRCTGIWNAWAAAYSGITALALFLNFIFSPASSTAVTDVSF